MSLIHELEALQAERGHLDPESLRELAARIGEPLYRLQEIISFYPHFRVDPPAPVEVHVCRDMSCHLAGGDGLAGRLEAAIGDTEGHSRPTADHRPGGPRCVPGRPIRTAATGKRPTRPCADTWRRASAEPRWTGSSSSWRTVGCAAWAAPDSPLA